VVAVMWGASSGRYMELNGGNLRRRAAGVNRVSKMKYAYLAMA
jgi:hypothetical protein